MVQEDETYVCSGPELYKPFIDISLGRLFYDVLSKSRPAHDFITDAHTDKSISYRQCFENTCILAHYLKEIGYGKDSFMSICSENNFCIPVVACFYNGTVIAPLNPNYTHEELRHCISISKPAVVFCSKKVLDKFQKLKRELSFIKKIIVIDSTKEYRGVVTMVNLLRRRRRKLDTWRTFEPLDGNPSDLKAVILCSSGTTGLPKGVLLSHLNLLIRLNHMRDPRLFYQDPNLRPLGIFPGFHTAGLLLFLGCIVNSYHVIMMNRFDEREFLKNIQKYKVNLLWVPPPLAVFLAKSPLVEQYDLSSVIQLISGAAPLSKNLQEALKTRLNVDRILQAYGLTETVVAVTTQPIKDEVRHGSSGKVVPGMKCKVRNPDTGCSLPANKVGEICVKGPMVMMGYYGNPEATKATFTPDGWLKTGDLGYYDEDGFFYIVDRLKELIKYKGFQVSPVELEALLLKHPKIRDCGVVGLPDDICGELPLAFVVKREDVDLTEKEVEEYVKGKISNAKHLRGGVIFVDSIPKNASGKIVRRELKNLLNKIKNKL